MIYAIATLKISNPESLAAYRDQAGAALAKHGGAVVYAGKETTALEGNPDAPDMVALLSFPNKEAAVDWANDPELTPAHDLRRGAGVSEIMLLG